MKQGYRMALSQPRILVVEDEFIIGMDIKDMLEQIGYDVSGLVATGEDAVKAAIDMDTDLVLMDILLRGDMDGIEAARQITNQKNIPVIYITACVDQITLRRVKKTRHSAFLVKPVEMKMLHTTIREALATV